MKTYKTLAHFIKRAEKRNGKPKIELWNDWGMKIEGKIYPLTSYGGGSLFNMDYDFAEFTNKKTGQVIYLKYICPSYQGGELARPFNFISAEIY